MKAILQVFSGDIVCKLLAGFAQLALIRMMSAGEFAEMMMLLTWHGLILSGWYQNLNNLYLVGHVELKLDDRRGEFDWLQTLGLLPLTLLAAATWWSRPELWLLLVLLSGAMGYFERSRTYLRKNLQFKSYATAEIIRVGIGLIGLTPWIVGWATDLHAWHFLTLQLVSCLVSLAWVGFPAIPLVSWRDVFQLAMEVVGGRTRYIIGFSVAMSIFLRIDLLLLPAMANAEQVAIYGVAYRVFGLFAMLLNSLHAVMLPMLQQTKERTEIFAVLRVQQRLAWIVAPGFVLSAALAPYWFSFVDGGKYPEALNVFRVLVIAAAFGTAFSPYVQVLLRYREYAFLWRLTLTFIGINTVLSFCLIPPWNAFGAAVATSVSGILLNLVVYRRAFQRQEEEPEAIAVSSYHHAA